MKEGVFCWTIIKGCQNRGRDLKICKFQSVAFLSFSLVSALSGCLDLQLIHVFTSRISSSMPVHIFDSLLQTYIRAGITKPKNDQRNHMFTAYASKSASTHTHTQKKKNEPTNEQSSILQPMESDCIINLHAESTKVHRNSPFSDYEREREGR